MGANDISFKLMFDTTTGTLSVRQAKSDVDRLGKSVGGITIETKTAQRATVNWLDSFAKISVIKSAFSGLTSSMQSFLGGSMDFQQSLANVGSLSDEVAQNYGMIKDTLKGYSTQIPVKSNKELADAMYQAVSACFSMSDALMLTEQAAKGSVAGLSTVPESMNALIKTMKAYKLEGKDSNMVMDVLFQTVRKGLTTFGEVSSSIAGVAPAAASMGVSLNSLMGAYATITKQGMSFAETTTRLAQAIPKVSLAIGETAFKNQSLQASFKQVYDIAGGNIVRIQQMLGGSQEAAQAVLMIGQNFKEAQTDYDSMVNSQGAAQIAFNRNVDTMKNQTQLLENRFKNLKGTIVELVVPAINSVTGYFGAWLSKLIDLPAPIKVMGGALIGLTGAFVALRVTGLMPLISSFGLMSTKMLSSLAGSFTSVAKVAYSSVGAFRALQTVLSVGVLGAVLGVLYYLPDLIKMFSMEFKFKPQIETKDWINNMNAAKMELKDFESNIVPFQNTYETLSKKLQTEGKLNSEEQIKLGEATKKMAEAFPDAVVGINDETGAIILSNDTIVMSVARHNELKDKVKQTMLEIASSISDTTAQIEEGLKKQRNGPNIIERIGSWLGMYDIEGKQKEQIVNIRKGVISQKNQVRALAKLLISEDNTLTDAELKAAVKSQTNITDVLWEADNFALYRTISEVFEANKKNSDKANPIIKDVTNSLSEDVKKQKQQILDYIKEYKGLEDKEGTRAIEIRKISGSILDSLYKTKGIESSLYREYRKALGMGRTAPGGGGKEKSELLQEIENLQKNFNITENLYKLNQIDPNKYFNLIADMNEKAIERITDLTAKNYDDLTNDEKEQLDKLLSFRVKANKVVDDIIANMPSDKLTAIKIPEPDIKTFYGSLDAMKEVTDAETENMKMYRESIEREAEKTKEVYEGIGSVINTTFQGIGQMVFDPKSAVTSLKDGLKLMLNVLIDYVEKTYIAYNAAALIESIFTVGIAEIKNAPLRLLGLAALETARGAINAFAAGGIVTKPTLAILGEAGQDEIIAPKKDFLTIARELINQQMPKLSSNNGQSITVYFKGESVLKGRDIHYVYNQQNKLELARTF